MRLRVLLAVATVAVVLGVGPRAEAQNTLSVLDAAGVPGQTGAFLTLTSTNDVPIQGFSVGATYVTQYLTMTGVDFTGTLSATASGGTPEYASTIIDDVTGEVIVGVIFDIDPTVAAEIPPTTMPSPLMHMVFDVAATGLPNLYPVNLVDGLGDPPVDNVFSSGGQSVHPTLASGNFEIVNLYALKVRSVNLSPGSDVDVIIELTNEEPIAGFTVSVAYDSNVLTHTPLFTGTPNCVTLQNTAPQFDCLDIEALLAPDGVEIILYDEQTVAAGQDWITMGCVFDFCPPFDSQQVPIGVDTEIIKLRFASNPSTPVGATTTIDLTNDFPVGAPVTNLIVTEQGSGIIPLLIDGTLSFVSGTEFKRGDSNGDNFINLADGIFSLNFLFIPGSPTPTCFDAADINGDGGIDITDVIFFLNFSFQAGCPPPPPYPNCGIDQDDSDTLNCGSYPNC